MNWLTKIPNWVVTILLGIIVWIGTAAVGAHRLQAVEKKTDVIESSGSAFAREKLSVYDKEIEYLKKSILEMEMENRSTAKAISEMQGDIKLILRLLKEEKP